MQITAHLNSLRIAPRKVRLLTNIMKGKDAMLVKSHLPYWAKRSSRPLEKLLDSAIANAKNNYGISSDNLVIKDILVDGGMVLKRFRPKGFGSASPIAKRTSHVTIVLDEKVAGLRAAPVAPVEHKHDESHHVDSDFKPEVKKVIGKKTKEGTFKSFTKKLFRQKKV